MSTEDLLGNMDEHHHQDDHDNHQHKDLSSSAEHHPFDESDASEQLPTAPPADYDFIENNKQINNGNDLLLDFGNNTTTFSGSANKNEKVFAEADSSSTHAHPKETEQQQQQQQQQPQQQPQLKPTPTPANTKSSSSKSSSECTLCPYYMLGCDYVSKINIPPKVRDLLLWKDPKQTGLIFGTSLLLLVSLASFSLLTVVGSLMLLALASVGSYRFYLALMFRIKGFQDETFEKLSSCDLSLPKDKVKELSNLIEKDLNQAANKIKSIILWDNVTTSSIALVTFYFVYCVGSVFNTLTLLILALVSAFTLPKVYQIYKAPIDAAIEKGTAACHHAVKQVMVKIPFLNKKKTQ